MKNKVVVTIAGQEYTMVAVEDEAYVRKCADYVDSQLRVHALDWQNVYLVTLDDEPVGIAFGDDIIDYITDHWGEEVDPAELRAAVEAAGRGG